MASVTELAYTLTAAKRIISTNFPVIKRNDRRIKNKCSLMRWHNTAGITKQSFIHFALIHAHISHLSAELKHSHFTYSSLNVGWKRKQKQSTGIENKRSVISQSHGMSGVRHNFQATHAQPRHSVDAAQTSFYPST